MHTTHTTLDQTFKQIFKNTMILLHILFFITRLQLKPDIGGVVGHNKKTNNDVESQFINREEFRSC
jgi:hypothetical protein